MISRRYKLVLVCWIGFYSDLIFVSTKITPCRIASKLFFQFWALISAENTVQSSYLRPWFYITVRRYLEGRTLNIPSLKTSNYSDVFLLTCSGLKEYFPNESQDKVKHITPENTAHWVNLIKHWLSVWLFAFYLALHLWFINFLWADKRSQLTSVHLNWASGVNL